MKNVCFCFCSFQIVSTKKLHMIKRLHVSGQSWFKAAEQCCLYLASKVATMLFHSSCVTFQPSQQHLPLYKMIKLCQWWRGRTHNEIVIFL